MSDVKLDGALLHGAIFSNANMSQIQAARAFGNQDTILPAGIVTPATWLSEKSKQHSETNKKNAEHLRIQRQIKSNLEELQLLAWSLGRMAREEVIRLENERPNDPQAQESNQSALELLKIFADGFEKIARALSELKEAPDQTAVKDKASGLVVNVGGQVRSWLTKNSEEVTDWAIRFPALGSGFYLLNALGMDPTVSSITTATLIGGQKVADTLRSEK